jgi:uncharacterized membrane protein
MSALAAVRFVAVLSAGLLAGIFFGDRMGASFARPELSPSSFVTFQQVQHVHFVKMMPVLLGIAILSSLAWLVSIRSRIGTADFLFLALGTVGFVSILVLTRAVNVPINNQLMTWSASSPPPDVMKIWMRWEQVHTVRTVIAVFGFACEVLALGTSTTRRAA